ncbi:MAG TPA: DUF1501 domain-containing protein [Isosphaeraceae bacterium]
MTQACPNLLTLSRRSLLKAGAAGFAGLNLPNLLRAADASNIQAKAKHVIFLHQWGGPSHLDTFDMKPDAPSATRSEFKPVQSSDPSLRLTEHLPRFAKVLGKFAQIRSVHHRMGNHASAGYYSLTGHAPPTDDQRLRDTLELYPGYGSVAAKFRPTDEPAIPSYASFPYRIADGSVVPGQGASFIGKAYDPFFVNRNPNAADFRLPELSLPASMPIDRLDDRRGLLARIDAQNSSLRQTAIARGIDTFYDRALSMLASPKVKTAFDLSKEPAAIRDAYGRTPYGQGCLLARRLVEAGTRFVTVYFSETIGMGVGSGGWDTHGNNFGDLKGRLLPITDNAVPTLIEDLESRGLLDETLVVWMGEFGRSPKIGLSANATTPGRDHWPKCYTVLMAGGGIRGGAVHGSSDKMGAYPATDPARPDDVAATIFYALGIDPATEVIDTLGRPLPIAAGSAITGIFG